MLVEHWRIALASAAEVTAAEKNALEHLIRHGQHRENRRQAARATLVCTTQRLHVTSLCDPPTSLTKGTTMRYLVMLLCIAIGIIGIRPSVAAPPSVPPDRVLAERPGIGTVKYSADGTFLAAADTPSYGRSAGLRLFKLPASGPEDERLFSIDAPQDERCLVSVAVSADSKYIAAGTCAGAIYISDINARQWKLFARSGMYIFALEFAPDGHYLYSARNGGVVQWEFPSGKRLREFVACGNAPTLDDCKWRVYSLAISPDGSKINTSAAMWDTASGNELKIPRDDVRFYPYATPFSSDGDRFAVVGSPFGDRGGDILVADLNGHVILSRRFENALSAAAFTKDGEELIVGGMEGFLARIRLNDGELCAVYSGFRDQIRSISLSADGESFAASGDDGLALWKLGP